MIPKIKLPLPSLGINLFETRFLPIIFHIQIFTTILKLT